MIITRKRMEEMLEQARQNGRSEVLRQNDLDAQFREVYQRVSELDRRIDRLGEDVYHITGDAGRKVSRRSAER